MSDFLEPTDVLLDVFRDKDTGATHGPVFSSADEAERFYGWVGVRFSQRRIKTTPDTVAIALEIWTRREKQRLEPGSGLA